MKNQNELILKALKAMDEILIEYDMDKEAVCDHSVGICWCDYLEKRETIKEAIKLLEAA